MLVSAMDFLDLYCQPLIGYTIGSYLSVEDDARMDATCTDIRAFHREYAYPMFRILNLDELLDACSTERWATGYLRKMSPYLYQITSRKNELGFRIPSIHRLPELRHLTLAIPLILDVTFNRIHPNTHHVWSNFNMFLGSLGRYPNKLETLTIVPGVIKMVRTDPITNEYIDEHNIEDYHEGSHLAIYRRFGMPVMLTFFISSAETASNFTLQCLHAPSYLMALATKKAIQDHCIYSDWNRIDEGVGSLIIDLLL